MKEKNYKKVLELNNSIQNNMALAMLINYGRKNILSDDYYNNLINNIEKNKDKNNFITSDFQKEILKIARNMAELPINDLYDYIKKEVHITKNQNKER